MFKKEGGKQKTKKGRIHHGIKIPCFLRQLIYKIAGYLKVNAGDAQKEHLKENALELQRIYLRSNFQHKGLGNVLFDYAEKIARDEKKDYMWLGVYEKNINAQHFYKRHGFKRVGQHVFQVGDDPQIDWLLLKKL